MAKTIIFSIVVNIVLLTTLQAKIIIGDGVAKNEKMAKKEALGDLSSKIQSEVKSETYSHMSESNNGNKANNFAFDDISVISELPILGVEYDSWDLKTKFEAKAIMDSDTVLRLYVKQLEKLAKEINNTKKKNLSNIKQSKRHKIYEHTLSLINDFNKYKTVAIFLGGKSLPKIHFNKTDIKQKLLENESKIESLEFGAKTIAKDLNILNKSVSFSYPKYRLAEEATQFSREFKKHFQQFVEIDRNAKTKLDCSYDLLKNKNITLSCYLTKNKKTLASKVITIPKKVARKYKSIPSIINYDMQLQLGLVQSDTFKVDLTTDKGTKDLLLSSNEEIKLLAKLTQAGCFYIIGTTIKGKDKFSYILELTESDTRYRHISCQDEETAGIKYITIGEFTIEKPYGIETLQIFAFNTKNKAKVLNKLPNTKYDGMFYKISNKNGKILTPKKALGQTRAMIPTWKKKNKSKKPKLIGSEAFLMINSME